jgi:hypothetical protein
MTTITCAFVAAGAIGFLGAPLASAEPTTASMGSPGKLVDGAGTIVQHWTVTGLKPSSDVIPYPVAGKLWEATATDEAIMGGVTPIVSNLNARAADGTNYQVLFGAATAQGVNPATLAQGQKTSGKVYFDVTGPAPVVVVYNAGGQDLLVWAGAAPAPRSSGGSARGAAGATAVPAGEAGEAGVAPAVEGGTEGTPVPGGSMGTPIPAGSMGTPIPEGSVGTPIPAASSGTPLPSAAPSASAAPTPVPAAVESPVASPTASPVPQPAAAKTTG